MTSGSISDCATNRPQPELDGFVKYQFASAFSSFRMALIRKVTQKNNGVGIRWYNSVT
jgi:hypothetical protein